MFGSALRCCINCWLKEERTAERFRTSSRHPSSDAFQNSRAESRRQLYFHERRRHWQFANVSYGAIARASVSQSLLE
jgi:hypothetical protein